MFWSSDRLWSIRVDSAGSDLHFGDPVPLFSAHRPPSVVDITPMAEQKWAALRCYHSQFIAGRSTEPPTFLDDVRDNARYWGSLIGSGYGEPLLCREEVGLRSLRDLV